MRRFRYVFGQCLLGSLLAGLVMCSAGCLWDYETERLDRCNRAAADMNRDFGEFDDHCSAGDADGILVVCQAWADDYARNQQIAIDNNCGGDIVARVIAR